MKLTYIATTYKDKVKDRRKTVYHFHGDDGQENQVLNLYPQVKYQKAEGFGGAITESAGYIFSLMDEKQKQEMLQQYFGKENMKYSLVRIPIDSCDFSLGHYEADPWEEDEEFKKFSFERVERYILPLLDAAEKSYGGKLDIMLSPWSPPAYMKTNGDRNHGGKLKEKYRKRWAEYLCRYVREYRNRGYQVKAITLQNEPKAVQTWDSCIFTAEEQKEFLRDYMWPAMEENHLEDIEIYIWDHNKERCFEWAETLIDETTAHMIAGLAFHWYSGDHFDALRMIREKHPDKKLLLSEACIEFSKFSQEEYLNNAQKYAHDMIGDFNAGMNVFIDWNLVLDEQGGPNHVKNYCDAPYLYHTEEKELTEGKLQGYLWHFSHFIEPGAIRIGTSCYTDQLEVTAFQTDTKIVFVLLNRTEKELPVYIRLNDQCVCIHVEPQSIGSGVIEGESVS